MLRRGIQPTFGRRATPSMRSTPLDERSRPAMKRSHKVVLVLLGSTALAGWLYSRSASPSGQPQQRAGNSAQPACDLGGGLTPAGCGDGRSPTQDPTSRGTATSSFSGYAGFFGLSHGGASSAESGARASSGTTTFGGFGGSGRAVAAHSAGG